ncbi:MAG: protein kinase, partial [Planctomycetota bacterium]
MPRGRRGGSAAASPPPPPARRSSDEHEFDPTVKRGARPTSAPEPAAPPAAAMLTPPMQASGGRTQPIIRDGVAEYEEGDVIENRFEVFGSAAGGMGRVLFVRDTLWKTDLAVKSLLRTHGASADEVAEDERMFLREAMSWLTLGAHPHIVSGYFARQMGGTLRFFMEYVPGGTLRHLLARKPRLEPDEALNYLAQLSEGMRYVHEQTGGRPHRDLKPDNCMVDEATGALKITDFGLLKGETDAETVDKSRANREARTLKQAGDAAAKLGRDALL